MTCKINYLEFKKGDIYSKIDKLKVDGLQAIFVNLHGLAEFNQDDLFLMGKLSENVTDNIDILLMNIEESVRKQMRFFLERKHNVSIMEK